MFTAPTAIRAIKKEDPAGALMAGHDLSSLRTLFLAGERLDPDTYALGERAARHPGRRQLVADRDRLADRRQPAWAWSRCRSSPGSPTRAGARATTCRCSTSAAQPVGPGVEGAICLRLPMPPGTLPTLWGDDERYVASYLSAFDGYYLTGDGGYVDEDGYLFVMGRTDDVLNVAGHRLSTGSLEAALAGHPAVAECAVIGVADELKGQVPRGLVVLKAGIDVERRRSPRGLQAELVARVRTRSGPVAALRQVDIVAALPKTRSGKILRKTMRRDRRRRRCPPSPATIEDASVLDALTPVLRRS